MIFFERKRLNSVLLCCTLIAGLMTIDVAYGATENTVDVEAAGAGLSTVKIGVHHNYENKRLNMGTAEGRESLIRVNHCPDPDSAIMSDIQRITMELMLICHGVRQMGIAEQIRLIPFPNITRGLSLLAQGEIDILGNTVFSSTAKDFPDLLRSADVIREGEFEVGLFTTENRTDILNKRSLAEFQQLNGVTVLNWSGDIRTMESLGLKQVLFAPRRDLLAGMIENRRADFTFSYLKEEIVTRIGGKLVRIPGVKASFIGARAFMIAPARKDILSAVNLYLTGQRAQASDQIRQAFIHAGFIAPEYSNWLDLTRQARQ